MLTLSLAVAMSAGAALPASPQAGERLSVAAVVDAVRSGESEETIVARIKRNNRPFDLTSEEREELAREGLSETIIKFLLDPTLQYTPPPPGAAPAPPVRTNYPADEFAAKVPPETGAYVLQKAQIVRLDLNTLVAANEGGFLRLPFLSGRLVGYLVGASSRIRVDAFPTTFYLRLAEPSKVEEVAMVALEAKDRRRELEFSEGKSKDAKPILKIEAMQRFDAVEVGPRLYKVTAAMLETGEYFIYLIGSADPDKGIQGKGYDFGVN